MHHYRKLLITATAGLLVAGVAASSLAQTGKVRREERNEDRQEKREDRQEKREDRQENREDRQDEREELREKHQEKKARHQELKDKEAAGTLTDEEKEELGKLEESHEKRKERLEALKERHRELKKDRKERRREARRTILEKYPKLAERPPLRAELKIHARRMARLQRAKAVAEADERAELTTKIDALIAKEKARHQARMEKLKDAKEATR